MDSATTTAPAAPAAPTDYISAGQAAKLLGCHIDTIRRWERAGALQAWRTPGNQRRFDPNAIQALKGAAA